MRKPRYCRECGMVLNMGEKIHPECEKIERIEKKAQEWHEVTYKNTPESIAAEGKRKYWKELKEAKPAMFS